MPIDDRTTNRSYPLPNAANQLLEDVQRLRDALSAIDADVFARYTKTEVNQLITNLINGAPGALDTLNELAAALGNDANFAATVTNQLALKAPLASPVLTGTPTAPTAAADTNTSQLATTAFVIAQAYLKAATAASTYAPLASPTFTGSPQLPNINGGPLAGFRNAIINGNFDVWQQATSHSAAGYGSADRWSNSRTGTSCTISRQAFAIGQTDVPNNPTYFCRAAVTSTAGASNFCALAQSVEGARTLSGQTVTLSFWAKADATRSIAVELTQYFGTGGSPSAEVTALGVSKVVLTTAWQKVSVTATLPSISGKTLGTDSNDKLAVNIWFDAGSSYNSRTGSLGQQSGTFDIAQVQLEVGSVATPFERRPLATEINLCKRYGQWVSFNMLFYATVAGQISEAPISWHEMRKTPVAGALAADPNTSQSAFNNSQNYIARMTPYGGSNLLQCTSAPNNVYVIGYRSWLDAEL
jgi:hypothetical protein